MGERHDRSVKSATRTMLGYVKEIRSLNGEENGSGRPADEEIEAILSGIEDTIEDYWDGTDLQPDQKDARWRMFVLAQFMEDLVEDMRPGRLSRKYGRIDSEEEEESLEELYECLKGQIRSLKDASSK